MYLVVQCASANTMCEPTIKGLRRQVATYSVQTARVHQCFFVVHSNTLYI